MMMHKSSFIMFMAALTPDPIASSIGKSIYNINVAIDIL